MAAFRAKTIIIFHDGGHRGQRSHPETHAPLCTLSGRDTAVQPRARDPRPILSKAHNDRSIDRWKGKEEMELHIFVLPFAKQLAGLLCGIAGQGAVQPADNLLREGVNRSLAVALLLWLVKSAKRCSGSTPDRSSLV